MLLVTLLKLFSGFFFPFLCVCVWRVGGGGLESLSLTHTLTLTRKPNLQWAHLCFFCCPFWWIIVHPINLRNTITAYELNHQGIKSNLKTKNCRWYDRQQSINVWRSTHPSWSQDRMMRNLRRPSICLLT